MAALIEITREYKKHADDNDILLVLYKSKTSWEYSLVNISQGIIDNVAKEKLLSISKKNPNAIILHKDSIIKRSHTRIGQLAEGIKTMYKSGDYTVDKFLSSDKQQINELLEKENLIYDLPLEKEREEIKLNLTHFIEKLEEVVKSKHLSYQDYSEHFGFTKLYFSNIRNNRGYPSFEVLLDIAKESNTSIQYLLGLTNVDTPCSTYVMPNTLDTVKLLKILKVSKKDFFSNFPKSIAERMYYTYDTLPSLKNMIRLSTYTNASIDYMFGLTPIKSWEDMRYNHGQCGKIKIEGYYEGSYIVSCDDNYIILDTAEKISVNEISAKNAYIKPQL